MNKWSNLCMDPELDPGFDSRQDMLEARFNKMFKNYWDEYLATGRIDDLDWSTEDLEAMSQQQNIKFKEIISNECAEIVLVGWD